MSTVAKSLSPLTTVVPITSRRHAEVTFYATAAQRFVYGQERAVEEARQRVMGWVAAVARRRSEHNRAWAWDLYQTAMLELTALDPSRIRPVEDEKWLRRRLAAVMKRAWYKERRGSLPLRDAARVAAPTRPESVLEMEAEGAKVEECASPPSPSLLRSCLSSFVRSAPSTTAGTRKPRLSSPV